MPHPFAGLRVQGQSFVLPDGRKVFLKGVSRWSLEFDVHGDGHFAPADFAAIAANGYNMVRFPTNSTYFLTDAKYPGILDAAITNALAAGLYVVIVGQWSVTRGNSLMAYPQDLQFWNQIAALYGNNPAIGFCPVTEPHDVTWDEWLHGWQGGPGMQTLVDTIRAKSSGIIFLSGLDWAKTMPDDAHLVKDLLANLMYEMHPYGYFDRYIAEWRAFVAAGHPLWNGELGIDSSGDTSDKQVAYAQELGTGYAAWAWTGKASDLADWQGQNRSALGQKLMDLNTARPTFSGAVVPATPPIVPTPSPVPVPVPTPSPAPQTSVVVDWPPANLSDGVHVPAMGFNHYNRFGNSVDEGMLRQVIDAMATNGMLAAGYRYVCIDDCWQLARDAAGNPTARTDRFPSGIKALADYAHGKGFKFGIYTVPGAKSCGGAEGGRLSDVATFAAWGVDYIKLDGCGTRITQSLAQTWRDAITATGRPMVLAINDDEIGQPWTWSPNPVNSWRTGADICLRWEGTNVDASCKCWDGNGSIMAITNTSHIQTSTNTPGHVGDPDMLEVDNGFLTWEEQKSHFSLWCMWSAPLLAGCDVRSLTSQGAQILLNHEVIALDQDPLVMRATKVLDQNSVQYWVKALSNGDSAVMALNTGGAAVQVGIDLKALGLTSGTYTGRDLWALHDVGTVTQLAGQASAHGVLLWRVRPTSGTTPAPQPPPVIVPPVVTPPVIVPPVIPPPPTPAGNWAIIDDAVDLSKLSGHSANIAVDTTNPAYFGGDPGRFSRGQTSNAAEWLTYHLDRASVLEADVYFWPSEALGIFSLEASPDGKAFTRIIATSAPLAGNWQHTTLHAALPAGTTDVRITWPAGGKPWDGQIGQVRIAQAAAPIVVPPPVVVPPVIVPPVAVPTLADVLALAKLAGLTVGQMTIGVETFYVLK